MDSTDSVYKSGSNALSELKKSWVNFFLFFLSIIYHVANESHVVDVKRGHVSHEFCPFVPNSIAH